MSSEASKTIVTRKYLSTSCSDDVITNYKAVVELARSLEALRPHGLVSYHAVHLYSDEDFAANLVTDRQAVLEATQGKLPILWVGVDYRAGSFDLELLRPILETHQLQLFREFDDGGFWGGA